MEYRALVDAIQLMAIKWTITGWLSMILLPITDERKVSQKPIHEGPLRIALS